MKIITHNGIFHADEIFAIALLKKVFGKHISIERTRTISKKDLNNKDVWVLDVGSMYSPIKHNFDHHQDENLSSTNMLVLNYLFSENLIDEEIHKYLHTSFETISMIDKNGEKEFNGWQVNTLIRAMNYIPNGWKIAEKIAYSYIESAYTSYKESLNSLKIWKNRKIINQHICYTKKFPIYWKRYKESIFLIFNDEIEQQFKLLTINFEKYPIHATGSEIFIHNEKFIAIYAKYEDALEGAKNSVKCINLLTK